MSRPGDRFYITKTCLVKGPRIFLAVGDACLAIFRPTKALKGEHLSALGSQQRGCCGIYCCQRQHVTTGDNM